MPNRNFSTSQKRLASNFMMTGRFADRHLSLKDAINEKHGTKMMSVSIIPLVILASDYGHPAFIVL
ncbi:MAG: hypothetical protein J6328_07180 [Bacilli bacterium]|nr:hypothetical protein [Bacilli bacterium]